MLCKSFRKFVNKLKRTPNPYDSEFTEATPGIEPGIRVLQTRALPLGHVAKSSDPKQVRTAVTAVKGRCLNHLTMGP